MSWRDLETANPGLAAFGIQRFSQERVAYLATVKKDGSPRVHPVTPIVGDGRLFVFMEPTSPKGRDLRRDGRYAIHSAVADANGSNGEFTITGRARLVDDHGMRALAVRLASYRPEDRYVLFELSVDSAQATEYIGDDVVRRSWKRDA
jgi:hypothetical protein